METIYKYALTVPTTVLRLPRNAHVLTVQIQWNIPTLWVRLNPDDPATISRTFHCCPTGGEIPASCTQYIGTFQAGWFVGHVFEEHGAQP